jgi:hypothetical protein
MCGASFFPIAIGIDFFGPFFVQEKKDKEMKKLKAMKTN